MSRPGASRISRRTVLRGIAASAAGAGIAAFASGCTGFATTGNSGLVFLSTQFRPVEEAERFRELLRTVYPAEVSYVTSEEGPFIGQVRTQHDANSVQFALLGGVHGDLAPLVDGYLAEADGLLGELGDLGIPPEYLDLAKLGTRRSWYVPWAQASYLLAADEDALGQLPPGVREDELSYDDLLDWAIAARRANGNRPRFGFPAGPAGLLHRFLQGYLYPSFTGGQITTFRSPEAVRAWEYLRELWANCVPSSTTYEMMQEALVAGEATIAWDHMARLVDAPRTQPGRWRLLPAPRGPRGLGYMAVVTGLGLPAQSNDRAGATDLIKALSTASAQVELLRANAFLPVVRAELPDDLEPALRMSAEAVDAQRAADDAILALPPVGLAEREGEVTKVFQDCFRSIVLGGANIRSTLDSQARVLQRLLDELRVPCWAPDPVTGARCEVA
ncbi:carbohydrate ABC transporter substrate-binding protein (CUT1 family) [Tamaricihabitans halophyticus]|uniref:Carbohydrate ABC transporter substrate-binding protein (CUT1 family) n=1 Tax=Tamaricihabitans halophyticus TaxID=1262583 RepID=A0A4R2QYC6_9PSEU|nr:carbohydrate ABC transporter substrate-binding protein (CUT1 family) [Tamaricihabitans halophyticus]